MDMRTKRRERMNKEGNARWLEQANVKEQRSIVERTTIHNGSFGYLYLEYQYLVVNSAYFTKKLEGGKH